MVALVNNAIGLSCLLPPGSGSTPPIKTPEQVTYTLIDWYLHVPCTRKETLQRLANYVVADAYFSKSTFVYGAFEMGFHVISDLEMTPISVISSRKSLQVKEGGLNYMTGKSRWSTWKRTDLKSSIWRMGKDVFFQR